MSRRVVAASRPADRSVPADPGNQPPTALAGPRRRSRLRDSRVWIGLFITLIALWYAFRDVDPRSLLKEFERANLWVLLGISIPAYLLMVFLRALRWRHLTGSLAPMPTSALFRAVAVGFMANNLFPLRMGEFVRSWYLGRETGVSASSIFGTVILERVVDTLMVILLALAVLLAWGGGDDGVWRRGVALLLPVALAPIGALAWLRHDPERALRWAAALLRPLPRRLRSLCLGELHSFSGGLGALSGGSHLFWIGLYSLLIWLFASTLPILAGFLALDVDLGSPERTLMISWMTLAAIGIAVALPSAPGFFGVYHSACRLVLERFGIPAEMALALGTLFHAVFWLTLTGLGLAVLRSRVTSLAEVERAAGG